MAKGSKKQSAKTSGGLFRPGLLVLAVSAIWLAQNEPPIFNMVSLAVWGLGGVTAGLLTRAGLALLAPLLSLLAGLFAQGLRALREDAAH